MAIFIDASVFCAYANNNDVHHPAAKKILKEIIAGDHGKSVTTDYIFDETVTVALRKTNKALALELGEFILNSEVFMARIDAMIFRKAWEIFREKHNISFTDCTIIAFMSVFGIQKLATFDKEFLRIKGIQVIAD